MYEPKNSAYQSHPASFIPRSTGSVQWLYAIPSITMSIIGITYKCLLIDCEFQKGNSNRVRLPYVMGM